MTAPVTGRLLRPRYAVTAGVGWSTEDLVQAGRYGYAHSCVISDNFPARHARAGRAREIGLLEFDQHVTAAQVLAEAERLGLERPGHEEALAFGAAHPDIQRERPIVFLHDPWFGYFGRWDVVCLWENAGRRELGLEDFDGVWPPGYRFAFVIPPGRDPGAR